MTAAEKKPKKLSIAQKVEQSLEELKPMDNAQLLAWARANGIDSGIGFSNFKKALLAHGIDYAALRSAKHEARALELVENITHKVTLYSDAKAKNNRFGITDKHGNPVWFGLFFGDVELEQSAQELAAAEKAVWLAGKIKQEFNISGLELDLYVDAEWLTWANEYAPGSKKGGKARVLGEKAIRAGIVLNVIWVEGKFNPADKYTACGGFQKYQDCNLQNLLEKI